jgi:hypothetical protein
MVGKVLPLPGNDVVVLEVVVVFWAFRWFINMIAKALAAASENRRMVVPPPPMVSAQWQAYAQSPRLRQANYEGFDGSAGAAKRDARFSRIS